MSNESLMPSESFLCVGRKLEAINEIDFKTVCIFARVKEGSWIRSGNASGVHVCKRGMYTE
jgi:hypothetical protein